MSLVNTVLGVIFAVCLPVGQVLFKLAADRAASAHGGLLERMVFNPLIYLAFGWYALSSLVWYYLLMRASLSTAYLFSIAGAALVPLAAWLVLREPVTARLAISFVIMLIGLYVGLSASAQGAR